MPVSLLKKKTTTKSKIPLLSKLPTEKSEAKPGGIKIASPEEASKFRPINIKDKPTKKPITFRGILEAPGKALNFGFRKATEGLESIVTEFEKAFTEPAVPDTREQLFKVLEEGDEAAKVATLNFVTNRIPRTILNLVQASVETAPDLPKFEFDRKLRKNTIEVLQGTIEGLEQKERDKMKELGITAEQSPFETNKFIFGLGSGIQSVLLAIGVGLLTKSPTAAYVTLGTIESSDTYQDAKRAGKTPREAASIAIVEGTGVTLLERLGFSFMFKKIGGGRLYSASVKTVMEELQETGQTVWQNLVEKFGFNESKRIFDGVGETIVTTLPIGFAAGGTVDMLDGAPIVKEIQDKIQASEADTKDFIMKIRSKLEEEMLKAKENQEGFAEIPFAGKKSNIPPIEKKEKEDPLAVEAKKFKSAEKFVKNLGDISKFDRTNKIDSGANLNVYDVGNNKVLKVAKDKEGLNEFSNIFDIRFKRMTPRVYEVGSNYILTDNATKLPEDIRRKIFSSDVRHLTDEAWADIGTRKRIIKHLKNSGVSWANDLLNIDNLFVDDFFRSSNWGLVNNKPFIIDTGAIIKNKTDYKSQLTDIYNQATQKAAFKSKVTPGKVAEISAIEGKKELGKYKKRLGVDFDVVFADKIFTGDIVRGKKEEAFGVSFDGKVGLLFEGSTKGTPHHEFVETAIKHHKIIPALKGLDMNALREEQRAGRTGIKDSVIDDEISALYEEYVIEKESNKPITVTGQIKEFFDKLFGLIKGFLGLADNINTIDDFYKTIRTSKTRKPARVKLPSRDVFKNKREVVGGKIVFDFTGTDAAYKELLSTYGGNPEALTIKYLNNPEISGRIFASYQFLFDMSKSGKLNLRPVEQELIQTVLETQFKGQKKVKITELERAIIAELMPLDIIETSTYSDYGSENVGMSQLDSKTLLFNSPFLHGKAGHFPGDFNLKVKRENLEIKEIPKSTQNPSEKYAVVRKGVVLTEQNIEDNVYQLTATEDKAKEWIADRTSEDGMVRVDRPVGLFAHARIWEDAEENILYVAEIQSDAFQADKLRGVGFLGKIKEQQDDIQSEKLRLDSVETALADKDVKKTTTAEDYSQFVIDKKEKIKISKSIIDDMNKRIKGLEERYNGKEGDLEKKFMNYRNDWHEMIVRQTIRYGAQHGFKEVRFPTPYTISMIEGYMSSDENEIMPYETSGMADLEVGDEVGLGGDTMQVVKVESETDVKIARADTVHSFMHSEAVKEDINDRFDETKSEFETLEEDFGKIDTSEKAQKVIDNVENINTLAEYNSKAVDIQDNKDIFEKDKVHDALSSAQDSVDIYTKFLKLLRDDIMKKENITDDNINDLAFKDRLTAKYDGIGHGFWNYIVNGYMEETTMAGAKKATIEEVSGILTTEKETLRTAKDNSDTEKLGMENRIEVINNRAKPSDKDIKALPTKFLKKTSQYWLDHQTEKLLDDMSEADGEITFDDFEDSMRENMEEAANDQNYEDMYGEVFYDEQGNDTKITVVDDGAHVESIMQPDQYEPAVPPAVFDYANDLQSDDQKTVARFYDKQIGRYLQKSRKGNIKEVEYDYVNAEDPFPWLATKIMPKDVQDVEAFKTKPTARKIKAETKAEVRTTQTALIKKLEESDLEANDKAKFIRKIKNIQTTEQLKKQGDEVNARIKGLEEKAKTRGIKSKIKKELKQTKVKRQAGKPVGKFTPEIQRVLNQMRDALRLNKDEAQKKIDKNLNEYKDDLMPDEVAQENRILQMTTGDPKQLAELLSDIQKMKETGDMVTSLKEFNRQAEVSQNIEGVIGTLSGGKGLPADIGTVGAERPKPKGFNERAQQFLAGTGKSMVGYKDILDMLSFKDKATTRGESFLSLWGDVLDTKNAEKKLNREDAKTFRSMVQEAYGVKKDRDITRILNELNEEYDIGTFTREDGVETTLTMSRDQSIKRYMEFKDPTLDESFEYGNQFTGEMKQAIIDNMTEQDIAYAEAQLVWYQEKYDSINGVYRDIYGIDLPSNPFYSPIKREGISREEAIGFGEFMQESYLRQSTAPGGLKSRVENLKPIRKQSSSSVLQTHSAEMNHFITWAKKMKDLHSVFGNEQVRTAIQFYHGNTMLKHVESFLTDFTRGGIDSSKNLDVLDRFRARFTTSVLYLKPSIGVKQLTSFIAFADDIPTVDFIKGFADWTKNPIAKTKFLMQNSELLKSRGMNIERDLATAMKTQKYRAFKKNPNWFNTLGLAIQIGDKGAITMGGWSIYKYHHDNAISQGKTKEEAIKIGIRAFESVTESAQQSADISELSFWQRGSSFAKLFSMFKSAPNQFFRKEIGAIRNYGAGRISGQQFAKTIVIYHFLIPLFFQAVSNAFRFDEESRKEYLRAMILGSFNGIFVVGDLLESMLRVSLGLMDWGANIPLYTVTDDIKKGIRHLKVDDFSVEDMIDAIKDISSGAGVATGVPVKQLIRDLDAGKDIIEGEFYQGLAKFLGWSEYALGIGKKKKKQTTNLFAPIGSTKKTKSNNLFAPMAR